MPAPDTMGSAPGVACASLKVLCVTEISPCARRHAVAPQQLHLQSAMQAIIDEQPADPYAKLALLCQQKSAEAAKRFNKGPSAPLNASSLFLCESGSEGDVLMDGTITMVFEGGSGAAKLMQLIDQATSINDGKPFGTIVLRRGGPEESSSVTLDAAPSVEYLESLLA